MNICDQFLQQLPQQIHKVHKNFESKKFELKELKTNLVWISKASDARTTRKYLITKIHTDLFSETSTQA